MINIAIDGYSGSGKGTLADGLAKNFNLKHLDTGSILRGMGLYFLNLGIEHPTQFDVENNIDNFTLFIDFDGNTQKTFLDGIDVSNQLRSEQLGQMASRLAVFQGAMNKLIDVSQKFAEKYNCVLDGRNITSEVLPHADVKIFLDADIECRIIRRYKEMLERGQNVDIEKIRTSINERDYRDTHRDFSPMVVVPDAVVVDNTNMTQDETIEYVSEIVKNKLKTLNKI